MDKKTFLKKLNKLAEKHEAIVKKDRKHLDLYVCHTFPEPFPAPLKDFVRANCVEIESDNFGITFLIKPQ